MNLRQRAAVFKALGHPARLAIVDQLGAGEQCVCALQGAEGVPKLSGPTISQHLLVLKNAGIIDDEKRGSRVFYRLVITGVAEIFRCVKEQDAAKPQVVS
jgi:DNA-binding transcriptional ArsR family regulator